MITITAQALDELGAVPIDIACSAIDYATIAQAKRTSAEEFYGCDLEPAWAILLNPEEDISIPIYVCQVHFNAFRLAVNRGKIGIDLDTFGDFD